MVITAAQETDENKAALCELNIAVPLQVLGLECQDVISVLSALGILDGVGAVSAESVTRAAESQWVLSLTSFTLTCE